MSAPTPYITGLLGQARRTDLAAVADQLRRISSVELFDAETPTLADLAEQCSTIGQIAQMYLRERAEGPARTECRPEETPDPSFWPVLRRDAS